MVGPDPAGGRADRWSLPAGLVLAVTLALALTAPAWGGRPPAGDDVMAHVVRADFAFSTVFGEGRTDWWFPRFMVGHQEFAFFGPGFTVLLGLIKVGSFGSLSTVGAHKVAGIVTFAAVPLAVAVLVLALGLGRRTAGVAAVLALTVDSVFGLGLSAIYGSSLVPNQLAASFFLVALGCVVRSLTGEPGAALRWTTAGVVALTALAVTHPITGLVLLVFLLIGTACLAITRELTAGGVHRVAMIGAAVAGLAAVWLVPFLAHLDLRGPVTAWETPPLGERLQALLRGEVLFGRGLLVLVLAGLVVWATDVVAGRRHALFLLVGAPVYLLVAHAAASAWPANEVAVQLANRGLGYAGMLALVPLAALLARAPLPVGLGAAVVAVVVFGGVGRAAVGQSAEPSPSLVAVAADLERLVHPSARFATERNFPGEITTTGVVHPDLWLAERSDRNTLNLFNAESSASDAPFVTERIRSEPPTTLRNELSRLGVSHVVTVQTATAERMVASGLYRDVATHDELQVLEIVRPTGLPDAATLLSVAPGGPSLTGELVRGAAGVIVADVAASAHLQATVAVGWTPKWRATVDGRAVAPHRTDDGLVGIDLPAGSSRVLLEWRPDGWDRAGQILSGVAVAGLGYRLSSLMSRRRSRTA